MSYLSEVLADSPLLYWRLNETSGNVADSSGNNRGGTPSGTVTYNQGGALGGAGDADASMGFDGTSAYVESTYGAFTGQRTFEGWAYRTDNASIDVLFGSSAGPSPVLQIEAGSNEIRFFSSTAGGPQTWGFVAPGVGVFFHWVLTFDATTKVAELFINGVSKGTRTLGPAYPASPGNFRLGFRAGGAATEYFKGRLDEIAIYAGLLSAARVAAHYTAGTTATGFFVGWGRSAK